MRVEEGLRINVQHCEYVQDPGRRDEERNEENGDRVRSESFNFVIVLSGLAAVLLRAGVSWK